MADRAGNRTSDFIAEKSNSPFMKRPSKFQVRKHIAFKNGVYDVGADLSPKKGELDEAM